MQQYLKLINTILASGTVKPAARENMPSTVSLFGYQFRHNLADGFPLLTTKKMYWKGVIVELLWFLRGDINIHYLVSNGVNIWNEDAFQYYLKKCKQVGIVETLSFEAFIEVIKKGDLETVSRNFNDSNYKYGDCGHQYGKVWRDFGTDETGMQFGKGVDQIKKLIEGLRKNPESRRHIVTAWDPTHDQDLALTWCHALFQLNCRPMTTLDRAHYAVDNAIMHRNELMNDSEETGLTLIEHLDHFNVPKYHLDCQLYQRSADVFLGVPFNIASYALLTEILAKMCNMVPGTFIHSFGDVHCYSNHLEAIEEQVSRTPTALPKLKLKGWVDGADKDIWQTYDLDTLLSLLVSNLDLIELQNYNPQPPIKAELSTGLKK